VARGPLFTLLPRVPTWGASLLAHLLTAPNARRIYYNVYASGFFPLIHSYSHSHTVIHTVIHAYTQRGA